MRLAANARIVAALGRRSVKQTFRRPQFLAPILLFPTLFLAVNTGGAGRATDIPGFPEVAGFLDFELAGAMLQSTMLVGVSGGIALALDIEIGFLDRLIAAPISRAAMVLGRLAATAALGVVVATWFVVLGLAFGARVEAGAAGVLLIFVLVPLSAMAFGGLGAALALAAGRASVVQGVFPLVFVILFLSSAFFPRSLMLEPAATVALYNPLSLIAEGIRAPVIAGISAAPLAQGLLGIAIVGGLGFALSALALEAEAADRMSGQLATVRALALRGLNEIVRVPGAAIPSLLAPTIFLLGFVSIFGNLTRLPGFTSDDFVSFVLPVMMLQGAGFTGAATGVNLARDIEHGWFDRLLASPAPRPVLLAGMIASASVRALLPTTLVLAVAFAIGAEYPGVVGLLVALLFVAAFAALAAAWGIVLALRFKTQSAAPLMQAGMFMAVMFTTSYAPLELLTGWLRAVATLNPVTLMIEAVRQGFVTGEVSWALTWPGLVAIAGMGAVLVALALRGMARSGR